MSLRNPGREQTPTIALWASSSAKPHRCSSSKTALEYRRVKQRTPGKHETNQHVCETRARIPNSLGLQATTFCPRTCCLLRCQNGSQSFSRLIPHVSQSRHSNSARYDSAASAFVYAPLFYLRRARILAPQHTHALTIISAPHTHTHTPRPVTCD